MQTITLPCSPDTNPAAITAALEKIQGQGAYCERVETATGPVLLIACDDGMQTATREIAEQALAEQAMAAQSDAKRTAAILALTAEYEAAKQALGAKSKS